MARPGQPTLSAQTLALAENWLLPPVGLTSLELLECATHFAQRLHLDELGAEDLLLVQPNLRQWQQIAEQGLASGQPKMSFFSSGSTGQPVRYTLPLAHLAREVDFFVRLLNVSPGTRRIWSIVPSPHIYGFIFTVLLPAALPDQPTVQDGRGRMLSGLAREFCTSDIVVAVPDWWRQWLEGGYTLPPGLIAVSAAAPSEQAVLQGLIEQGAQLLDVYGASQTGGIGYRQQPDAPFTLLPHWHYQDGRLVAPEHQAALPDRIEWCGGDRFHVLGRQDGVVQIAGHNVSPEALSRLLEQHHGIAAANVRPHGQHLKAFLIPTNPSQPTEELVIQVREWLLTRIPAWQVPQHFTVGIELPRTALGKAADWPLPDTTV